MPFIICVNKNKKAHIFKKKLAHCTNASTCRVFWVLNTATLIGGPIQSFFIKSRNSV